MTDSVINENSPERRRAESSPAGPEASGPPRQGGARAGNAEDNPDGTSRPRRRRGSRGGRGRGGSAGSGGSGGSGRADGGVADSKPADDGGIDRRPDELPERSFEGKPSAEAAERALVRKPKIGDSRPAPEAPTNEADSTSSGRGGSGEQGGANTRSKNRRRRGGRGRGASAGSAAGAQGRSGGQGGGGRGDGGQGGGGQARGGQAGGGQGRGAGSGNRGSGRSGSGSSTKTTKTTKTSRPVEAIMASGALDLDDDTLDKRRGRSRNGRPVGRYLMTVSARAEATQIAVLEGRTLIEHYVSRPADDVAQIHGNIYLGRVQNVLPGMEAAFIDIGTPKNAVLYRGDVQYDAEDIEHKGSNARIEDILKAKQTIICQVTKNPIMHKGARLTQEVSLPGRFVVLIPNSSTYGISKRLPDDERKRLRSILDKVKPAEHGLIVRTAAEGVTDAEISADVLRLLEQWDKIEELARNAAPASLLYREPDMAVRVIREEFNDDYRGVMIDDRELFEEIHGYVSAISPALADRVQFYDTAVEPLPISERFHVHEQLHKALDRKVWLPSGGSLIIEHTEALTVIDVNTGKNVGSSSLEETVYRNNLEAAIEIAKQLRLRDIGGIIVIDFVDMEIRKNRDDVIRTFRDSLARDKTRTQVFDISELGLVEMTRKRIGEGLLESFSTPCPDCEGRGVRIDEALMG